MVLGRGEVLRFSDWDLPVDDANARTVKEDLKRAKELGLIRIKVMRGINLHERIPPSAARAGLENLDLSIAEKALKGRAVSHGTTYSPGIRTKILGKMTVDHLDTQKRPYAVFDFHYRSRGELWT